MIIKACDIPDKLRKLEALKRRIIASPEKVKEIEGEYAKVKAGYKGELSLSYFLNFLPSQQYHIFYNVRLPSYQSGLYFQMDILLLSKNFIVILEVKNIAGQIIYDPAFQQIIRLNSNGQEEVFKDPVLQVHRQKYQFQIWLQQQNVKQLPPIFTLAILSNPNTLIKTTSSQNNSQLQLIRPDKIPSVIKQFENHNNLEILNNKELKRISTKIMNSHVNEGFNIFSAFHLSDENIKKGVHCPDCFHIPLSKSRYNWICSNCNHKSKNAHLFSLEDFYFLYGQVITNNDLRNFLNIPSRHQAKRILQSVHLTSSGKNRGTKYILELNKIKNRTRANS